MPENKINGIFIGGTGTGVGKTFFSILLITYLENKGLKVAPMKPVETGCNPFALDSLSLMTACRNLYPIDLVCPYRLKMPSAPQSAAMEENKKIEIKKILDAFESLKEESQLVIVEGAGAIATPYTKKMTGIELAKKMGLPVILVTNEKLGTVGQTISAIRALHYSRVKCLGVVLSSTEQQLDLPHLKTNEPLIKTHIGKIPFLGTIPHIPLPGGNLEKTACSLIPSWAKKNIDIFQKSVGSSLDFVLKIE